MKTLLSFLAFSLIIQVDGIQAQRKQTSVEKAVANYTANLQNDNHGAVFSSMIQLMAFTKKHPEAKLEASYAALVRLMHSGSADVREYAFLTLSALLDKRMLFSMERISDEYAPEVFGEIAYALGYRQIVQQ